MASHFLRLLIPQSAPAEMILCVRASLSATVPNRVLSAAQHRCVHVDTTDPARGSLAQKYDIKSSQDHAPSSLGKTTSTRFQNDASASFSSSTSASESKPEGYTHFGYTEIPAAEKEERVKTVFTNVAESYDLMNDAMSFGIHRLWKDQMVRRIAPTADMKLLDVAGGTGDIAFRVLRYALAQQQHNAARTRSDSAQTESATSTRRLPIVTVCDINESMLRVGERRAAAMDFRGNTASTRKNFSSNVHAASSSDSQLLSWVVGDAERLPFEDNSFDVYTIAFGIRNVTNIDQALREAYRVLKPNGRFVCLEFSHVKNAVLEWLYEQYSFQVIPPLGLLLAQDWHSYQYLVESIRMFPTQDKFKEMIEQAGFRAVTYENMTNGLVALHSGFKIT